MAEKIINYVSLKAFASGSFLKKIKRDSVPQNTPNPVAFEVIFRQGLTLLEEAVEENDRETFMEAAGAFAEASVISPTSPEPYFFLAYIFSFAGDKATAMKYYQAVKVIKPDYPGLDSLKNEIFAKNLK